MNCLDGVFGHVVSVDLTRLVKSYSSRVLLNVYRGTGLSILQVLFAYDSLSISFLYHVYGQMGQLLDFFFTLQSYLI